MKAFGRRPRRKPHRFGTYRLLPFVVSVRKPRPGESSYDFIGEFRYLPGPRGLPLLLKPPFGSIVAIDMNTGEHRWRIPVGRGELFPAIRQLGLSERMGFPGRSWALVTKTVMIVVQMGYFGSPRLPPGGTRRIADLNNFDPHLWVYDKASGEMLAEIALPANATGAPITYMADGKQFGPPPTGNVPQSRSSLAAGDRPGRRTWLHSNDAGYNWPRRVAYSTVSLGTTGCQKKTKTHHRLQCGRNCWYGRHDCCVDA